jgi:hypothetical protein
MAAIWKGAHPGNFSRGRAGHRPEAIVIHIMDGTLAGTDSWFNDPASRVSAHYGIGRSGQLHQYVREADSAHHAGTVVRPSWPLLKPRVNPNFYTLGIEHEGRGADPNPWPGAMLQASLALARDLAARWSIPLDPDHVIPHWAIRANKPNCPGIDMDAYIAALAEAPASPPPPVPEESIALNVRILRPSNIRPQPSTDGTPLRMLIVGDRFDAIARLRGESVGGNDLWFRGAGNDFLWAGNTDRPHG